MGRRESIVHDNSDHLVFMLLFLIQSRAITMRNTAPPPPWLISGQYKMSLVVRIQSSANSTVATICALSTSSLKSQRLNRS